MDSLAGVLVLIFILSFYFVPSIIAFSNNSKHVVGIFFINLLFGWTGLGWIAACIWACVSQQEKSESKDAYGKHFGAPIEPAASTGEKAESKGDFADIKAGWIGLKDQQKAK